MGGIQSFSTVHPSHLGLLRDMESSGAGLPHALHSPRRGRQSSSSLVEPSQSLPLRGDDTIGAACRQGCGVYPPVFCASPPPRSNGRNPGRPAFPRGPHRVPCALPPDPQNLTVGQLQSSFPKVIYRWQVEGGGGSPFHITHMCMGKVGDELGQSRTVPARDLKERPRREALDGPLPQP